MHLPDKFSIEAPAGTVRLRIDIEEESYCVEYDPLHDKRDAESMDEVLPALGMEMMDEDECPRQLRQDGTVVVWCATVDGEPL